jgi:hypothetical protein
MDTENDNTVQHDMNRSNDIKMELSQGLSIEDWSDIESIRSSYSSIFQNQTKSHRSYEISDRITALITWSEFASERAMKLIHFFQQIDEFENLNVDDRFTLVKYNLLPLFLIQKCHCYDPLTGKFANRSNEDASKRRQFFALCYGSSGIRETYLNFIRSFSMITDYDSTLINLILVMLLFSKGLSMSENEPILNDVLAVNKAQSHYARLTWNYLLYKHGEKKTLKQFTQIMGNIARIQSFTKYYRDFFRSEIQCAELLERFAPLMQAVLNIA